MDQKDRLMQQAASARAVADCSIESQHVLQDATVNIDFLTRRIEELQSDLLLATKDAADAEVSMSTIIASASEHDLRALLQGFLQDTTASRLSIGTLNMELSQMRQANADFEATAAAQRASYKANLKRLESQVALLKERNEQQHVQQQQMQLLQQQPLSDRQSPNTTRTVSSSLAMPIPLSVAASVVRKVKRSHEHPYAYFFPYVEDGKSTLGETTACASGEHNGRTGLADADRGLAFGCHQLDHPTRLLRGRLGRRGTRYCCANFFIFIFIFFLYLH